MTEVPSPGRAATGGSRTRRRAAHSREAVVAAAVDLLDEAGEGALTFRALAARLGGGVGSIYWYVSSRDELLDFATDLVLERHLAESRISRSDDPLRDLRTLALALFDVIGAHPWTGAYMMRDTGRQPHALAAYERLGAEVLRLGLSPRETFDAVSAVLGFVVGTAIDLGQQPPEQVCEGLLDRGEYLAGVADHWRELDPQRFPFLHYILDEFAGHDDADQFRAGLDLLLAGLRQQAGR